ncbi:GNAT family N-acetyltransferase, partial [Leucobacter sp. M11]|uniref:GNAT family N-acetyltransferase n=1 Tax=Leucobacter sp. M11 TaxID=2993565 RepID=UPI002D805D36
MRTVELRTERLLLDQPREADIDAITAFCQDPLFERFLTTPWPYRREHAEGFIREIVPAAWTDGSEATWAIRLAERPTELLGVVCVGREPRGVGYWQGAAHRGAGIVTEALAAVIDWRERERPFGAEPLSWSCFTGNIASARTARAAGFHFLGTGPSP